MRETKVTRALKNVGIYNDSLFFGPHPYIWNRVRGGHRDVFPSGWYVSKRGEDLTDGKGHWNDQGQKFFSYITREDKAEALEKAIAWARERFGIEEWARSPFGGYGPKVFVEKRLSALLNAEKELAYRRDDRVRTSDDRVGKIVGAKITKEGFVYRVQVELPEEDYVDLPADELSPLSKQDEKARLVQQIEAERGLLPDEGWGRARRERRIADLEYRLAVLEGEES